MPFVARRRCASEGRTVGGELFEARLIVAADVRAWNEDTVGESQKAP